MQWNNTYTIAVAAATGLALSATLSLPTATMLTLAATALGSTGCLTTENKKTL